MYSGLHIFKGETTLEQLFLVWNCSFSLITDVNIFPTGAMVALWEILSLYEETKKDKNNWKKIGWAKKASALTEK